MEVIFPNTFWSPKMISSYLVHLHFLAMEIALV